MRSSLAIRAIIIKSTTSRPSSIAVKFKFIERISMRLGNSLSKSPATHDQAVQRDHALT